METIEVFYDKYYYPKGTACTQNIIDNQTNILSNFSDSGWHYIHFKQLDNSYSNESVYVISN